MPADIVVTQVDIALFHDLERFAKKGFSGPILDGEAIYVIARHRQAERERCAVIAENEKWGEKQVEACWRDGSSSFADHNEACDCIAQAIRSQA